MFPTIALLTVLPVLYLGHFADSLADYLVGGFFLGLGGTTFAIGIPFVNAWFPPERRGLALGVFGAGMGGTAISAFSTVQLAAAFGPSFPFDLVAIVLVVFAAVAFLLMRDHPGRPVPTGSVLARLAATARMAVALQLSFLYAVAFGGFVAFSTYLPTYLNDIYDFDLTAAGTRTAGFALAAVVAWPLGGVLSDRIGPRTVVAISLAGTVVLAVVVAFQPPLEVPAGIAFVALAFFLGLGAGGVFAWVAQLAPPEKVGTVTGVAGAAGGLGGFFPPLVMGATYELLLTGYGWG
jgi:NNP family nitrate/nitrite transporter-like MFS transporter